jgi:hypothetical protein
MKKILAIGIGLFSYLISNIQLDISKAKQNYFVNTTRELVTTKVAVAIDLKGEKSISNNIGNDTNIENQYFFIEPQLPFILGFGMIDIYGQ